MTDTPELATMSGALPMGPLGSFMAWAPCTHLTQANVLSVARTLQPALPEDLRVKSGAGVAWAAPA